jgi:hypothetical protein
MPNTTEFEDWLVPARSKIQSAILQLLKLLRNNRAKLEENKYLQTVGALLAEVGFSLWRSVFLVPEEPTKTDLLDSVDKFLETVIRDNAITYRDDKNIWSFRYYIDNARNSLLEAIRVMPPAYKRGLGPIRDRLEGERFFWGASHQQRWEILAVGFEKAISTFESLIRGPNMNKLYDD